jgi:DNA (cytosine-5)-methyltransferase 1
MRYFSMFSGIGGFELALERAIGSGADCVGYSEIDLPSIETYSTHFQHVGYGDATLLIPQKLPRFDLLVAGFPCQPFSVAGRRHGFQDVRGTLFFDICRVLEARQPRMFILENVKGLLSHDHGRTFRTIIYALVSLGYGVQWKVLNSKNFGVPQHRERVYIVGYLGGQPGPKIFRPSGESNPYTTLGVTAKTAVARTLTAGGHSGGNHSGMTILRTSGGDRRLTPNEWERLQGFPDGWTTGSDSQRYKQCGNAVTVPVAEALFRALLCTT